MVELPTIDDTPPDEELSGPEMHDRWTDATNLTASELRDVKESKRNKIYKERNSGASQPGDEPLDDAIRLAETPKSEWGDKDDGFNEYEEAEEALNFLRRTGAQGASCSDRDRAMIEEEEPHYGKQEMSLVRWGFDPCGFFDD